MRAREVVPIACFVASFSCGTDVVVGINGTSRGLSSVPASGSPRTGPDLTALVAVRRTADDGHVAGGWVGCAGAGDPACDAWLATVTTAVSEEARIATPGPGHVQALALLEDDRIAGGARDVSGVANAWLARRASSGAVWDISLASDVAKVSETRAVERAPDGTIIIAGNERIDANESGWLARVGPDGAIVRRIRIGGTPSSSESTVDAITVLSSGRIFIGGRRRQTIAGRETTTPVILDYGPDLTIFNSNVGIGLDGQRTGVVHGVLGDRDHEITACAQLDEGVAVVRMEEAMTSLDAQRIIDDPAGRIELGGCSVTDDGAIVLAGTLAVDPPRPWAAKIDRLTLEPRWIRRYDGERGRLLAVASAGGGGAVAVGTSDSRAYSLPIDP